MRAGGWTLLIISVALVGGCVSPVSAPPEVPFEVPSEWSAGGVQASGPSLAPWWRRFDDPSLDALVQEALQQSPTLDAARARLRAAVGVARLAGADSKPQADLSLDGVRRQQNFIGLPIPGTEGQVLTNTSTNLGLSINAAWEIDLWGRLATGRDAASVRSDAATEDLAALQLSLVGQVTKAWFGWLEARQQVGLAEETLSNRSRTRQQIEDRYRLGLRTALDLRLAKANEADARAQLSVRRQNADRTARRLEVLVARYPAGDSLELGDEVQGLPEMPELPALASSQPAVLVTQRPDLAAAERRLAAAGLDVQGARAALYPRLRLSGSVGGSSVDLEDLLDTDFSVWSLAAGLLQPIFQGGRLRATVDIAEARRQEAAAGYISAALGAFSEVEGALAAENYLDARLRALTDASEQSLAARELAERRYRSGLADYLTVLESQRLATLSQSQLLTSRREQLDARTDLHLALGGDHAGTDEQVLSNDETH